MYGLLGYLQGNSIQYMFDEKEGREKQACIYMYRSTRCIMLNYYTKVQHVMITCKRYRSAFLHSSSFIMHIDSYIQLYRYIHSHTHCSPNITYTYGTYMTTCTRAFPSMPSLFSRIQWQSSGLKPPPSQWVVRIKTLTLNFLR